MDATIAMKIRSLLSLAALALVASTARAEGPSDSLTWTAQGRLRIQSTVVVSDGCYSAGPAQAGAPEGERPIRDAVLVTFPLEHSGQAACTQALKPIRFSMTTEAPAGAKAVIIYTTDKRRNSVDVRALALPSR